MPTALPDTLQTLIDGPAFATVATVQPDGSPQLSVVWVKRDGHDILFSTLEGRRKHLNIVRDPRVTLLVNPADAPYTYGEVRGTATFTTEGGWELIDELSRKYTGQGYDEFGHDEEGDVRIVVRISPRKVVGRF